MTATEFEAFTPPDIPSKWDIIPIHNSDRNSFKRCRRYWDWNSPARQNLILRADIHGVSIPLWFGTGIHYCLEQYYNPGLQRDPVESWRTWFDIQWRGGIVTEDWLDKIYDLKPQAVESQTPTGLLMYADAGSPSQLYKVRGLEDIIPDPDHNTFDDLFILGTQMMDFYKEYAEKNDDFTVLMVEHDFSVPIWDYEKNTILRMIDTRTDSPNYGKELEVHSRGRQDGIKVNNANGRLGIIDHKTAAKVGEDYFLKLENDEQCTNYLYAAQVEAAYYDLPHKGQPLEDIIYNVMRKAYPKNPTELQNGSFSVARETESTTYDILTNWISRNMPGVPLNLKQQAYVAYLKEVGDEQFIIRRNVRRNKHQILNAGYRVYLEALDMLSNPSIYPNISNDWLCLNCQLRGPCLAKEDGGDWEQMIKDNYTSNKNR